MMMYVVGMQDVRRHGSIYRHWTVMMMYVVIAPTVVTRRLLLIPCPH
jgi:hypothetical protein